MDKKRKGYQAGAICSLIFFLFLIFAINNAWNISGQILWVFTFFFGGLAVGSFWKPEFIGEIASQILESLAQSRREESVSHDKQVQKKSSGSVQVMATHGAKVNVTIPSGKKENAQNLREQGFLRKETIFAKPSNGYYYEFELMEGEHLKGEISATNCIDIYFLDDYNFDKWERDKSFECEYSNEDVLETSIDYEVPTDGTWYLILENNGRKSATVKVQLY